MLATRLTTIRQTIHDHCTKSYRELEDITLIAVSKNVPITIIEEAIKYGIAHFGENRIQEAIPKIEYFKGRYPGRLTWHFVGSLQANKIKKAIEYFDCIHSVDSEDLCKHISTLALEYGVVQDILLQVNVSGEESKHGFSVEEIIYSYGRLKQYRGIRILGLMTIAPYTDDKDQIKLCFWKLSEIRKFLQDKYSVVLPELSMGMSNDYKIALEEGATMLRIGRKIFGERER